MRRKSSHVPTMWVDFSSGTEEIVPQVQKDDAAAARKGVGPLIPPLSEAQRPLRQQVFERVRAAGLIPRVQLARELAVSPASVTTITQDLIETGLIEEVAAPRDGEAGRGRPAVALGVRADACRVAGMKLSDREHTCVIVDFAGNLIADDVIPRRPGPMALDDLLDAIETLLDRVCAKAGMHSWAKGLSRMVGKHGITVNCIPPGRIHSEQIFRNYTPEYRQWQCDNEIPMGPSVSYTHLTLPTNREV